MATPPKTSTVVTNATARAQVVAANAAAQASAAAAQAKAAAADAARKPVLTQSIAGIAGINKAIQGTLAAFNNPNSSQAAIDKALTESKAALAANKTNLASITPEQKAMAIEQGQIYTSSMADVDMYNKMIVNVPDIQYQTTYTATDGTTFSDLGTYTKYQTMLDDKASANTAARAATTTALEDFKANLQLAGLGELVSTIDEYIKQDLTAAQIKINLVGTQVYKNRFPGMAPLAAAGKAINEATYISIERGMVGVLKAYGLDDKVFGTTDKLGGIIGNQVSVTEFENRVQMASDKVKKNTDVLAALNEYYGVLPEDAVGYLLDPKLGMDIVKKRVRASEIGAAAEMYKFDLSKADAESYINVSGTSDLNALKESFGQARLLADTQTRLSQIEGTQYSELEAVAAQLGQDRQRQLESQRRALREQARFAGQSGVTAASLRKESSI
jgi:hypothetical protein